MTIDGKYVEMRTSAHYAGPPSKLWKIDYKNGLSNSIVVEAETEDEAKHIGLVESRKNAGFNGNLNDWPVEDVIASAVCIKDYSPAEPEQPAES